MVRPRSGPPSRPAPKLSAGSEPVLVQPQPGLRTVRSVNNRSRDQGVSENGLCFGIEIRVRYSVRHHTCSCGVLNSWSGGPPNDTPDPREPVLNRENATDPHSVQHSIRLHSARRYGTLSGQFCPDRIRDLRDCRPCATAVPESPALRPEYARGSSLGPYQLRPPLAESVHIRPESQDVLVKGCISPDGRSPGV